MYHLAFLKLVLKCVKFKNSPTASSNWFVSLQRYSGVLTRSKSLFPVLCRGAGKLQLSV